MRTEDYSTVNVGHLDQDCDALRVTLNEKSTYGSRDLEGGLFNVAYRPAGTR